MKSNLLITTLILLTMFTTCNVSWGQDLQDITIDLKKLGSEYKVDFGKSFNVKFAGAKKGTKAEVKISSQDPPMSDILSKSMDLLATTLAFTHDPRKKKPVVKNAAGADVEIDGNFKITIGDNQYSVVKTNDTQTSKKGVSGAEESEISKKIPYWTYLGDDKAPALSLKPFYIDPSTHECCDDCESCDDSSFDPSNRIIYDARSGVTYFVPQDSAAFTNLCAPSKMRPYRVSGSKKIVLNAGDPVVLIVENVNPALYNIEISDSSFLTNNESTGLLESLVLQKSEGAFSDKTAIQGGDDEASENNDHLVAKAGLMLVRAEMSGLLENFRLSNLYLHNCIQKNKREALKLIDKYPTFLLEGKYGNFSFLQLVDIFLNQETEDSLLNKQIRTLYSEFLTASYKIAYRYPQIPEHDILNFRIAIKPKSTAPYPALLNTQMRHPTQTIYVRRFFKVDVSSGLYMGSKKDQAYSLVAHTTQKDGQSVDVKRIVKEDRNTELGFASYLHMYYKFNSWINPAFTIGAGISFDRTVRPRYFTGLSLLVGQNNRICISGGAIWGNYEDLSKQYSKTKKEFDFLNASASELAYKTTFKGGLFVSLSYNLPFLKRKSNSEAKPSSSNEEANGKEKAASKAATSGETPKDEEKKGSK